LEPELYNLLNTTHHLLNLTNPPLAGDCWLLLFSGPLHYVVTPSSLLHQSVYDTTPNSTSTKPKVKKHSYLRGPLIVSTVQEDIIQWGNWLLASMSRSKTVQPPPLDVQLTDYGAAAQEPSLFAEPLLIVACQLTGRAFAY
jgi:hypothetical protein